MGRLGVGFFVDYLIICIDDLNELGLNVYVDYYYFYIMNLKMGYDG